MRDSRRTCVFSIWINCNAGHNMARRSKRLPASKERQRLWGRDTGNTFCDRNKKNELNDLWLFCTSFSPPSLHPCRVGLFPRQVHDVLLCGMPSAYTSILCEHRERRDLCIRKLTWWKRESRVLTAILISYIKNNEGLTWLVQWAWKWENRLRECLC